MASTILGEQNSTGFSNLITKLIGADFNVTTDQAFAPVTFTKYVPRRILVTNASANLTLAVGGIYTDAAKGGSALVANTQVYTALSTSAKILDLTLAAIALSDIVTAATLYLSLTVAQGGAATGDLYIFGDVIA